MRRVCRQRVVVLIAFTVVTAGLAPIAGAQQFDAPYYALAKKSNAKWAAEDRQIDAKLAALEKRFGKKLRFATLTAHIATNHE